MGRLQANQHAFHDKLKVAGFEVWTAWLPDDLSLINDWLREKTGVVCSVDGLVSL